MLRLTGLIHCLLIFCVWTIQRGFGQVVINEITPNPYYNEFNWNPPFDPESARKLALNSFFTSCREFQGPVEAHEWVELYNRDLCQPVDISCWILANNQSINRSTDCSGILRQENMGVFVFPRGTIIPPRSFLLIAGSDNPFPTIHRVNPNVFRICVNNRWFLQNAGGWLGLYQPDGTPVDAVYWTRTAAERGNILFSETWSLRPRNNQTCNCPDISTVPTLLSARELFNQNQISWAGSLENDFNNTFRRRFDGSPVWTQVRLPRSTPDTCNAACLLPPQIRISPGDTTICAGTSVRLTSVVSFGDSLVPPQNIFLWTADPGGPMGTTPTLSVSPNITTSYTLTLTQGNCTATAVAIVRIDPNCGEQIINEYTKITHIDTVCAPKIQVTSTRGFAVGDTVLIAQMKGAEIDTTNTPQFGRITDAGTAGNYEFNIIEAIDGNEITLRFKLTRPYNPAGALQLVSVPQYQDVTFNRTLTAREWDGNIGGILVFEAAGTVRFNQNVDVSAKGFRSGFASVLNVFGECDSETYYYDIRSGYGGTKGEGINVYVQGRESGRGSNSNGGGGGNSHNGGGAGGGNYGAGGDGGYAWDGCRREDLAGGKGGRALQNYYSNAQQRIFLGGGGGGGHQNDNVATPGGRGGGIAIIKANRIEFDTPTRRILANGGNALDARNDGAGGGGAGGTILLDVNTLPTTLNLEVNGGRGGNNSTRNDVCHGTGGGGGGGLIWLKQPTTPTGVTARTNGGNAGLGTGNIPRCLGNSYGATNGSNGAVINNLVLNRASILPPSCGVDTLNRYTKVYALDTANCVTRLTIGDTLGFEAGTVVLVIQMQGAEVDTSLTQNYGRINTPQLAGNYEFATIQRRVGRTVELQNRLLRAYDASKTLQLVNVPQFTDVTFTRIQTARVWNGATGGVLVFEASGAVTLNANIDVSERGFRGGMPNNTASTACNEPNIALPVGSNAGGKGEGVGLSGSNHVAGSGAFGSGGGGGNTRFAGGGGGGGAGRGGFGGNITSACPSNPQANGQSGNRMLFNPALNKVYLGGGGGAGHQNAIENIPGGRGGGIVIIRAGSLRADTNAILANGESARPTQFGGSGGGGGGAVLLDIQNYQSRVRVQANGGNGSNNSNPDTAACFAPGGGGGGGVIWVSQSATPANLIPQTLRGQAGRIIDDKSNCRGQTFGATAGINGLLVHNLTLPRSNLTNRTNCISGIINQYTRVINISSNCTHQLTVSDTTGFRVGDLVLLMQMQGAAADSTNNPSSGRITELRNAGRYEYARIEGRSAQTLQLANPLRNQYSIYGRVQLIRVPEFNTPITITDTLTAQSWDGNTGGVLAFRSTVPVRMSGVISVRGLGFRGGQANAVNNATSDVTRYLYRNTEGVAGQKGEGIIEATFAGQANFANGGGGGNARHRGGQGGQLIYDASNAESRLFLGGGGGGGHQSNGGTGHGGNGGGIVLLRAPSLEVLNPTGSEVNAAGLPGRSVGTIDGAGGGGAGGSVVLDVNNVIGRLNINLSGGDGGNSNNRTICASAGKPGSGGFLATTSSTLSPNIIINRNTGNIGQTTCTTCACPTDTRTNSGFIRTGYALPINNLTKPGSPCISGIINKYAAVTGIQNRCPTVLEVDSTAGFFAGDTVLLIQMQGAAVDSLNPITIGQLNSTENAGNYEFVIIERVLNSRQLALRYLLERSYDVRGSVQLVTVPRYRDVWVADTLTARAWNGTKGGVLAFEASGTTHLIGHMNVSGKGFRGGRVSRDFEDMGACPTTNLVLPAGSALGAGKGEGIAVAQTARANGRSRWTNGGGGGNHANGGGGGGANFTAGGQGGFQWSNCPITGRNNASGGQALPYSNALNKVYLGGGGGGGHQNNTNASYGGNGGGLIYVKTNTLRPNTYGIYADGNPANRLSVNDGGGGGGAGGTVLLEINRYTAPVIVSVRGGDGGSVAADGVCHGPGGGGSGGVVWHSNNNTPALVQHQTQGGTAGINASNPSACAPNPAYGATAGNPGGILLNLRPILGNRTSVMTLDALVIKPVTCGLETFGSIDLSVTDGSQPYTYRWSNGQTTQDLNGLSTGTFTVTVTDALGCTATLSRVVLPHPPLSLQLTRIQPTPCGQALGEADALVTGGTPPYLYTWGDGSITPTMRNAKAGEYLITVTDARRCVASQTFVIPQTAGFTVTPTVRDITCGQNQRGGSIHLSVRGGKKPYLYTWSNRRYTKDLDSIPAGEYFVTVTDSNRCVATARAVIQSFEGLKVNIDTLVGLSCAGYNDGKLAVGSVCGAGNLSYNWSNGQTTRVIQALAPGIYTVTVTDENGCTGTATRIIEAPRKLTLTAQFGQPLRSNEGEIIITAAGGSAPYFYQMNDGVPQSSGRFSFLPVGTYRFLVFDQNGCMVDTTFILLDGLTACGVPQAVVITTESVNSNALTWQPVLGAARYELIYKPVTESEWLTASVVTHRVVLTGLRRDTRYEARVRAICTNGKGSDFRAVTFTTSLCGIPANLELLQIAAESARLSWYSARLAIGYALQYRRIQDALWRELILPADTTTFLTGLEPGTKYLARVRSICPDLRQSIYTPELPFETPRLACGIPQRVEVIIPSAYHSAIVKWDSVPSAIGYEVNYRPFGTELWKRLTVQTTETTLNNVQINTGYQIRVRALCSRVIASVFSPVQSFYTGAVESDDCFSPQNLSVSNLTVNSATISWTGPAVASNYRLFYKPVKSSTWLQTGVSTPVISLTGLLQATDYELYIQANCSGEVLSVSSPTVRFSTAAPICPPVNGFDLQNVDRTRVSVRWSEPSSLPAGYQVSWRKVGTSTWSTTTFNNPTALSATIPTLQPNTSYEIRIRSRCLTGAFSEWSVSRRFMTMP